MYFTQLLQENNDCRSNNFTQILQNMKKVKLNIIKKLKITRTKRNALGNDDE